MTAFGSTKVVYSAVTALFLLSQVSLSQASSIPMPDGSRTWILVQSSDCDDDGPNVNVDRGHCIGAVSQLITSGDIGHDRLTNHAVYAEATITPETMRGTATATSSQASTWLDMSMIDTYTLNGKGVPNGTVVPITVSFRAVATLSPFPLGNTGAFGGGAFAIKIGNSRLGDPIVIPENNRVNQIGPTAAASYFGFPLGSGADVPLDLTATHTMDVTVGTPFDLAFYLGARPQAATLGFMNTATIGFVVPEGTFITSVAGYGQSVPVQPTTWGSLKARYTR